jgi:hypothetical protein
MSDESDYKDYQDYQAYQQHIAKGAAAAPSNRESLWSTLTGPDKLSDIASTNVSRMRDMQANPTPKQPDNSTVMDRLKDPDNWKAMAGYGPKADTNVVDPSTPLALPAAALPKAVQAAAEFANSTAPRRIALGAAQGAATEPSSPIWGAVKGGAMAAGGELVSGLMGRMGDATMQAAVGRKKFTPGIGTTLADEGVVGTRNGMTDQVNEKLASRGGEIRDLAKQIPAGAIDANKIGSEISAEASRPMLVPGAEPSAQDAAKLGKIQEFANDVSGRGAEDGEQALARRIAAGGRSYNGKEDPLQSLLGNLSKSEQIKYSSALKDAHMQATGTPDLAEADSAYGALKRAQSSLNEPVTLPKSLMGIASQSAHILPGGSLALSSVGQALVKGGQTAKVLNNPLLREALLQSMKKR